MITCITCKKKFKLKSDYTRHTQRKFPCKDINAIDDNINEEIDILYTCKYCQKTFSRNYTMIRHVEKYCKSNPDNNIIVQLEEQLNTIKTILEELQKSNSNIH